MILLYILLATLAVVFLALIIPVRFYILLQDEFSIKVNYLFFGFSLFPTSSCRKKKKEPSKLPKMSNIKKLIQDKGIVGAVDETVQIVKKLLDPLGKLLGHVRVSRLAVSVTVANPDAAVAAVEYGAVCAVLYPFAAWIESTVNAKKRQVDVQCDFNGQQSSVQCNIIAQMQPIHLLAYACSFIFSYTNQKIKEGAKNGRK